MVTIEPEAGILDRTFGNLRRAWAGLSDQTRQMFWKELTRVGDQNGEGRSTEPDNTQQSRRRPDRRVHDGGRAAFAA